MSDSNHTLDSFKQMLSQTFESKDSLKETVLDTTLGLDDSFDDLDDYEDNLPMTMNKSLELSDDFDDFDDYEDSSTQVTTKQATTEQSPKILNDHSTESLSSVTNKSTAESFVGINSVKVADSSSSLREEIENTIYNLGFTMENCISEYNDMFGTNLTTMEELYSNIIYNNYFKHIKVTDINTVTAADLLEINTEVQEEMIVEEKPYVSRIEQELSAMDYPEFIQDAVHNNRIPVTIFDKYNDLFKALYVVDYLEAFGEEVELGDGSDVVYTTMVGKYMYGMSELDYKKIMYLTFRTDMGSIIMEKGSVESYADITFYKISKLLGSEIETEDKEKFYIATKGIQAFTVDIVWHNAEEFLNAIKDLLFDVIDGKLVFHKEDYIPRPIVNTLNCESSLTAFVSKPTEEDTYFYYNYNKFLEIISNSDLDVSETLCNFFTNMSDMDIARYDFLFGNILKYNKELLGCVTSEIFEYIFKCMFGLPGREPIAFASYRLINILCSTLWRSKYQLATTNMTQELNRECVSIDILGIPGINMMELADFWRQFDALRTYLNAASKITLSVFNSIIRLKIE